MTKILVVEDDRSLREALAYNLRREDYTPIVAGDASTALELARREEPQLILLDLMLPGGNGFDVCRSIRAFTNAPIIIMTARGEDIDRILGLEIGADDYVTKPFNLRELLARVRANLRRVQLDQAGTEQPVLEHGALTVDIGRRSARVNRASLSLQPKEFDLLVYFLQHRGRALTRSALLSAVWGHDFVGERTVDVHVHRVRTKLEESGMPGLIRTIHGIGYVFEAAGDVSEQALEEARS